MKTDDFDGWVRQYRAFLYRAAWGLTGDRAAAEDLVQETFTQAWRSRHQLRMIESLQPWLYRILRREAGRRCSGQNLAPLEAADAVLVEFPAHDERIDLVRALQRISPRHREILVLFYLSELDYAGLADALEIPPGTVMSRLNRAREALRLALGGDRERHVRQGS